MKQTVYPVHACCWETLKPTITLLGFTHATREHAEKGVK